MLWLKSFHIAFVISWMAALLYLPRLFVYHAETAEPATRTTFGTMERRLLKLGHVAMALTLTTGVGLLHWFGIGAFCIQAKLLLVAVLVAYHGYCAVLVGRFARDANVRGSKWYRWFNEIPALVMLGIVILVVVKPAP